MPPPSLDWRGGIRIQRYKPNTIYIYIYIIYEPGELSQWLCHDDSTINTVVVIIIIINIIYTSRVHCL